jgi:hypothetical protein
LAAIANALGDISGEGSVSLRQHGAFLFIV